LEVFESFEFLVFQELVLALREVQGVKVRMRDDEMRLIRCSIVMYCLPLDRTGYSWSQDVTCLQVSAATWYLLSLNVCVFIARAH
jgi:hypothetical protein